MTARWARALGLLAAAASLFVAACDDANPPSPLPATRDPNQPVTLSPNTYLLRPDQLPGYVRSSSVTLSPQGLASEAANPSLQPTFVAQGLTYGVRYTYGPPTGGGDSTAFRLVVSEALIFQTASGAAAFFSDEKVRQNTAPSGGGSIGPLDGVSHLNSDEVAGFDAKAGADAPTTPPQSFLVLARRGRVVIELLGGGTVASATRAQFDKLLALQESTLAQSPDG
jgi:hypothetical protein